MVVYNKHKFGVFARLLRGLYYIFRQGILHKHGEIVTLKLNVCNGCIAIRLGQARKSFGYVRENSDYRLDRRRVPT
jgi:hypothetical protein